MRSNLPRPIINVAKSIVIPILRFKWKRNSEVKEWLKNDLINDEEIDWLVLNWQRHGRPIPPPPKIKQGIIKALGKKYNCKCLVETGTYKGDMINAQIYNFEELHSIELSEEYHIAAKERFKNYSHVFLHLGDSGVELPKLTPKLTKKTLFWLDGHYCGGPTAKSQVECPIYAELDSISDTGNEHIILIDDARMFIGKYDYPTISELRDYLRSKNLLYSLSVVDDIIRIIPTNDVNTDDDLM